jgi:hypothetical protein
MKLKAEIKDGKFIYNYRVGTSKQEGRIHLSTKTLLIFCKLLEFCACASDHDSKDRLNKLTDEVGAKAWIEKHPAEAGDYINKINQGE